MGNPLNSFLRGSLAAQQMIAQLESILNQRQQRTIQQQQSQADLELNPLRKRKLEAETAVAEARPDLIAAQTRDELTKAQLFELPTDVSDEELAKLPAPVQLAIRRAKAKGEPSLKVPSSVFGQLNTSIQRTGDVQAQITSREEIATKDRESREKIAKDRIRVADDRTKAIERRGNLPSGTLRPILDEEGFATGEFVNTRTGQIVFNEDVEGKRFGATPEGTKNRAKALTVTKTMIANLRRGAEGLMKGEDIVANATLLQAQLATLGQIAKGLGGEAGVLATQDIERAQATIPGVVESYLAGKFDVLEPRIRTKLENLENILKNVESIFDSAYKKKGTDRSTEDLLKDLP